MSNIETLINEMSDNDLHEMAIISAGYGMFYVGDKACAKFELIDGRAVKFGPFEPLHNSDHLLLLLTRVASSTTVVCISVGADKTMCEFLAEYPKENSISTVRRAVVKGCIKKWMEHNGFQSVISMGDLHRRLVLKGLVDPSIAK